MNQQRAKEIDNNAKTTTNPSSLIKRNHNRQCFRHLIVICIDFVLNSSDQEMMM